MRGPAIDCRRCRFVEECSEPLKFNVDSCSFYKKRTANANLIAAAPEMLEFVEFFKSFAGQILLKTLGDEGIKIYEEAKRLSKKARGEG